MCARSLRSFLYFLPFLFCFCFRPSTLTARRHKNKQSFKKPKHFQQEVRTAIKECRAQSAFNCSPHGPAVALGHGLYLDTAFTHARSRTRLEHRRCRVRPAARVRSSRFIGAPFLPFFPPLERREGALTLLSRDVR